MKIPEYILNWPLYVTDDGKVTCYEGTCEDVEIHMYVKHRRVTTADFLLALTEHIKLDH